jgi:hypothetical protein
MPPLGYETYASRTELTVTEQLELDIAQKMNEIMRIHGQQASEGYFITPKVEYEAEGVGENQLVRAWLEKNSLGGEIHLCTQVADTGTEQPFNLPARRVSVAGGKKEVVYQEYDKGKLVKNDRRRFAMNILATLDLIDRAVKEAAPAAA